MTIRDHTNNLDPTPRNGQQNLASFRPKVEKLEAQIRKGRNAASTKSSTNEFVNSNNAIELPGAIVMNLDPNRLVATDADKELISVSNLTDWILGAIDNGNGTVTLPSAGAETDPIFSASPAFGIGLVDISNWNAKQNTLAAGVDYEVPLTFDFPLHRGSGDSISITEQDPVFVASAAYGVTGTLITNWNAAYGWGNHAIVGYLTHLNFAAGIDYQTPLTFDSPLYNDSDGDIGILKASSSSDGYLSSTDWIIFNSKEPALLANQKVDHSTISISPGTGMSGGGDLTATRTLTCTITQYTDALARASISETITGIEYSSSTGVLSLTTGYAIPTTVQLGSYLTAEADTLASVMARGATTALQLTSTLAIGTSPLAVTSTTVNTNLNADLLDGNHAAAFQVAFSGSNDTDNYITDIQWSVTKLQIKTRQIAFANGVATVGAESAWTDVATV